MTPPPASATPPAPSFAQLFTPKLVTIFREGYGLRQIQADAIAGLTVAIVALPLSMAIAIASGVSPDRGLFTAIVGGFLVSALGGSRFQIGGPAGAFIVLIAETVMIHGLDGLILATMMSGVILLGIGFLRLGTYIKFIPYPVTVGFTAGIAVIIFASQLKELLGLTLSGPEPGPIVPKLQAILGSIGTFTPSALVLAMGTISVIVGLKHAMPRVPGMLIAVAAATLAAVALDLPVETIGSRFGGIASSLPAPHLPEITLDRLHQLLPNAIAFALLGAIESLLSAVVADGMTGRRHRSNCELVAQGIANIGAALFGGFCVTGTIARTATNVRAGAIGPISGMLHAVFLLVFLMVAAPLASYIPLAALAGVLATVAWNMAEHSAFLTLLRTKGDAVVLLATFLLTIFRGLTEGIVVGFALGTLLFVTRIAQTLSVERHMPMVPADRADGAVADRVPYVPGSGSANADTLIYRVSGAFFFGAASTVEAAMSLVTDPPKTFVLDFANVPYLDSTGANTIAAAAKKARSVGTQLVITGASPTIQRGLWLHGVRPPEVSFVASLAAFEARAGNAAAE